MSCVDDNNKWSLIIIYPNEGEICFKLSPWEESKKCDEKIVLMKKHDKALFYLISNKEEQ